MRIFRIFLICFSQLTWSSGVALPQRDTTPTYQQMFSPVWRGLLKGPCERFGYSFIDDEDAMKAMSAAGANIALNNLMWVPREDASAPNGNGMDVDNWMAGGELVEQEFHAEEAFEAVRVCVAGYGKPITSIRLSLLKISLQKDNEPPIATARLEAVPDNGWAELELSKPLDSGFYLLRISEAKEPAAVWVKRESKGFLEFNLRVHGAATYAAKMVFQLRTVGHQWDKAPKMEPSWIPVPVKKRIYDIADQTGIGLTIAVGDWNNGFFPYYGSWWYKKYPDFSMVDQAGKQFKATMFDSASMGWPAIDHPDEMAGVRRFVQATVESLRADSTTAFWILGGESLYPTYAYPDRWADYSKPAVTHFRAWLKTRYLSIDALNAAWKSKWADFDSVEMPAAPEETVRWRDFLDFRFRAMAERFAWHYQSVLSQDASRPILIPNHGTIFTGLNATYMGMMPEEYAGVGDGFECGQIIEGDDAEYYNLMWAEALASTGRPVAPIRLAYKYPDPNARGGGKSYTPEAARRYGYETLGMGAWVLGYIQWQGTLPDGEWGIKGTPAEGAIRQIFGELKKLQPYLTGMWPIQPGVGWYLSRAEWSARGFQPVWTELHRTMVRNHIPKQWFYDGSDFSGVKFMISANNEIISNEARSKLKAFVENGGTLLLSGRNGEYDENFRPTEPLFGALNFITDEVGVQQAKAGTGSVIKLNVIGRAVDDAQTIVNLIKAQGLKPPFTLYGRGFEVGEQERRLASSSARVPVDLYDHPKLSQSLIVPTGELTAISFTTPTWTIPPADVNLKVTVHKDTPDGTLLGELTSQSRISDNSWLEVKLKHPAAKGTKVWLVIEAPKGLQEKHLGVWAAQNPAYEGGELLPINAAENCNLDLKIRTREKTPDSEHVLAFMLTNGRSQLLILQNLAKKLINVNISLGKQNLNAPTNEVAIQLPRAQELLSGKSLSLSPNGDFGVMLPPSGSAVVYLSSEPKEETPVPAALPADTILSEEKMLRGELQSKNLDPSQIADMKTRISELPGVRIRTTANKEDLTVTAEVIDRNNVPVKDADVTVNIIPMFGYHRKLLEGTTGKYSLRMKRSEMPLMYDYPTQTYVPFSGSVSLEVNVTMPNGVRAGKKETVQLP